VVANHFEGREIVKSKMDDREYKAIVLNNKLECLLIREKDADKSAASMSVNVGHMDDPVER
jgi:insulysin